MAVIPPKDLEAIQFFETHDVVWAVAPITLGLTAAQVAALDTLTKAARNAYNDQQSAKTAAKAATTALHTAVAAMRSNGADLVATIKAFAETTNNMAVYANAQIPPPATPTPAPPPGQPKNFVAQLTGTGAIQLSWKSENSAPSGGVYFTIRRKLTGEGSYTLIGTVGGKKFTDSTIPSNSGGATYIVQGFRGENAGDESDGFTIQFGVGGAGFTASVMKIAA